MSSALQRGYQSALTEIKRWKILARRLEIERGVSVFKRRRDQIKLRAQRDALRKEEV